MAVFLIIISIPSSILITEVMSNPIDEDTGEFIELYNNGDSTVDLAGWSFTDGDAVDVIVPFEEGESTALRPKGFALILDREYAGEYDIPPGVLLLTTKNTTLGDGLATNDPITLFDKDGNVVDTFSHPFNPGNGISVERVSPERGDEEGNWRPSRDPSGSTPGRENSWWALPMRKAAEVSEDVVINEIMYAPDRKAGHPEWIELYNRSTEPVDLSGYRVGDASGREAEIPEGTIIRPLSYLVLTTDLTKFKAWFPGVEAVQVKFPPLNNSGDTVKLISPDGRTLEEVTYKGGGERDRSIERVDPFKEAGDPANWRESVAEEGSTPGKLNSVSNLPAGDRISLSLSPRIFNPELGRMTIRYEAPLDSVVTLYIFNSAGALIKTLLKDSRLSGRQTIEWDGRDERGRDLPTGLYLCQIIASMEKGKATAVMPFVIKR